MNDPATLVLAFAATNCAAEALSRDKRHLIVVPSGALTALPFHLLVTEKPVVALPQVKTPRDLVAYRDAAWLLKRHAVSVLPSVASLKAVRVFAHKDEAKSPLIGFGDPVFNSEEEGRPSAEKRTATRSYTEFWKGVDIDRSQLSCRACRRPRPSCGRWRRISVRRRPASICARMRARARSSMPHCPTIAWSILPRMALSPVR
jgi:hypothetical protein